MNLYLSSISDTVSQEQTAQRGRGPVGQRRSGDSGWAHCCDPEAQCLAKVNSFLLVDLLGLKVIKGDFRRHFWGVGTVGSG